MDAWTGLMSYSACMDHLIHSQDAYYGTTGTATAGELKVILCPSLFIVPMAECQR